MAKVPEYKDTCQGFVDAVKDHQPDFGKWKSTCCFTWLTTWWTLGHVQPSTQRGDEQNLFVASISVIAQHSYLYAGVSRSTRWCGHTSMQTVQLQAGTLDRALLSLKHCVSSVVVGSLMLHRGKFHVFITSNLLQSLHVSVLSIIHASMYYCRAAGQALTELFYSAPVQSFINGMTAKALHPDKAIYQPGTLRKVSC